MDRTTGCGTARARVAVAAAALAGAAMTAAAGGRIAFVDRSLDNYHANVFLDLLRGELKGRGWTVAGCTALDEAGGRAWAAKRGVPYVADDAALADGADAVMVLAPSNPEVHLDMVRRFARPGKPIWVDKTFAPDLATAREIFAVADAVGAPIETASALRYTAVQARAREVGPGGVRRIAVWTPGRSFAEYAVHGVELAVSCLGPEAVAVQRRGAGEEALLLVDFTDGRTATIHVACGTDTPYAAMVTTRADSRWLPVDGGRLFADALSGVLDFFDAKAPTFDRAETLAIMAVLDAARDPRALTAPVRLP